MSAVVHVMGRLNSIRLFVSTAGSWRSPLIALLAGAVSALAFAPYFLSPLLFFTLPILIWLTDEEQSNADPEQPGFPAARFKFQWRLVRRGAWIGWWFGFGIHTAGLYWIGNAFLVQADDFAWLLPFAMVLLPAGLALFHSLAIALLAVTQGPPLFRVLACALVLGVSEWLRGTIFTGFPWNVLGYALTQPLELMQFAGVTGIYGLTFIAVLVFATPLAVLAGATNASGSRSWTAVASRISVLSVLPLAVMWAYGAWMLGQPVPANDSSLRLMIVQPSIVQKDKFDPQKWNQIFEKHVALTRKELAARKPAKSATYLIFWPEAAMPFLALREQSISQRIAQLLPENTYLVTGLLRAEQTAGQPLSAAKVFNSAVVYDPDGKPISIYDKYHLVPFGEYLPFQATLEAVGLEQITRQRGGFTAGPADGRHKELPAIGHVLFMICYEAIFPVYGWSAKIRPKLLINLTNDAWFGNSSGPYQHFHQSRVRAVEQGLPLVRAANNGKSGVVGAQGRVLAVSGLDAVEVTVSSLPAPLSSTFYTRFGNSLAALLGIMLAMIVIIIGCNISTVTVFRR